MKLSELILLAQKQLEEVGDVDCYTIQDYDGESYSEDLTILRLHEDSIYFV